MYEHPGKNPYRPGVGLTPLVLAGREQPIKHFRGLLNGSPGIPANMRMTGLRGVGKTVLLKEFAKIADQENWAYSSIELLPRHNNETVFQNQLISLLGETQRKISALEKMRASLGKMKKYADGLHITWQDVTFSYSFQTDGNVELAKQIFKTTELAIQNGQDGFVLLFDEAQILKDDSSPKGDHPLSALIAAIAALQSNDIPVGLVLCGLPTLTRNLLKARSYTERMFRGEDVTSLAGETANRAFLEPLNQTMISATPALVDEVIAEVEGYPYFIQFWGAELWDAAIEARTNDFTPELLAAIREDIYSRLDLDFYRPRVDTLTPAEQDVLLSTANCSYPPLNVADIKKSNPKSPENINVILGRLIEAGVMYRVIKGSYEYTAPNFANI